MNAPAVQEPASARILVRGVNWLGDAVMSTPALIRLREAHPNAVIALLTPEKLAELWQHHPAVNKVITFAPPESPFTVARRLRQEQFGTGLVLPNSFRSALELWLAGVPERIGYAGHGRSWLLTRAVGPRPEYRPMRKRSRREIASLIRSPNPQTGRETNRSEPDRSVESISPAAHHLHQYLHLVRYLHGRSEPVPPQLFLTEAEVEACLRKFDIEDGPGRPLFGLNAGAEYGPAKRWPADHFVAAAREIQKQTHCRWIIFGGKADVPLARQIANGIQEGGGPDATRDALEKPAVNLAGATSLRELCAALKACRVLLTNDTGPMHIAAAVGTPVVVPFGSTSPELTGPGLPGDSRHRLLRADVPCAPCFLRECPVDFRCMRGITVPDVVQAVVRLPYCASLSR